MAVVSDARKPEGSSDLRLGEALVRMGLIDHDELRAMLSLQKELRRANGDIKADVVAERFRLGRLLVDSGVIDAATLEEALARSRRTGRRLGETLIEAGAISGDVLQRYLDRQRRLTAMALAGVALWSAAPAPAEAGEPASVQISATVLSHASIDALRLPQEVVISEQDVARGYVELDEPLQVELRTNHPAGVVLWLSLNSERFAGVHASGFEDGAALDSGGVAVLVPQRSRGLHARTVSLKVRLMLAPHAAPGRVAFPVSVSLAPA